MASGGTVIDSLVVELGLDPSKFTKGQKEALEALRKFQQESDKADKEAQAKAKKSARVMGDLQRQALELGAVLLGGKGAKDFLAYITNMDAAAGRMAHTLDINVSELSAWQGAIKQVGGSVESITGTLTALSGEVNKFSLTGDASFVPMFDSLGISVFDANHNLKTSAQLLLEVADAIDKLDESPARKAGRLSMLPGANPDSINLLLKGRGAMEDLLRVQKELGTTTDESADAAQRYQASLANLERSSESLGRTLVTALAPVMTTLMDVFTQLLKGNIDLLGTSEAAKKQGQATPWWKQKTQGQTDRERREGTVNGIPLKPGAGASSAATNQVLAALAGTPGLKQVTGLNDDFHKGLGGLHPQGRAVDITVSDPSRASAITETIRAKLKEAGIDANVINEYDPAQRSKNATGGHIHIGVGGGPGGSAPGAGAAGRAGARGGDTTTTTTSVHVGQVVIHDASGNPDKIARGIVPALKSQIAAPFDGGQQ